MQNEYLEINKSMKKQVISSYMNKLIYSSIVFIGGPIGVIILTTNFISTSQNKVIIPWAFLGVILLSIRFIAPHFKTSIYLIGDIMFNDFVTCKIQHQDNIINRYDYFPEKETLFTNSKGGQATRILKVI